MLIFVAFIITIPLLKENIFGKVVSTEKDKTMISIRKAVKIINIIPK